MGWGKGRGQGFSRGPDEYGTEGLLKGGTVGQFPWSLRAFDGKKYNLILIHSTKSDTTLLVVLLITLK